MKMLVDIIDILFRRIQPERTLQGMYLLNENIGFERATEYMSTEHIPPKLFSQVAQSVFPTFSEEEIQGVWQVACGPARHSNGKLLCNSPAYATLIMAYQNLLRMVNDKLVVCYEHLLTWQQLSLTVGQDLCTTAAYAYNDYINQHKRSDFSWETMLHSNCRVLHTRLQEGLAENHSHLGGTSQIFALNWAYLMNHPNSWSTVDQLFTRNLSATTSFGVQDNVHTWAKRIRVAATVRCRLFMRLHHFSISAAEKKLSLIDESYSAIPSLQLLFGAAIRQVDETEAILDYALEKNMEEVNLTHPFRVLAAERKFMYDCFRYIFKHDNITNAQNAGNDDDFGELFYLYLVIKAHFRSELIQNNNRYGFANFKDYQDRKDSFFWSDSAYVHEQTRMAINGSMQESHIKLMETRIAPSKRANDVVRKIRTLDQSVLWEFPPEHPFFYVAHFIKIPDSLCLEQAFPLVSKQAKSQAHLLQKADEYAREERLLLFQPRNIAARNTAMYCMYALERAFVTTPYLRARIIGLDAASTEIGCRPEVFAPAIVRLRHYRKSQDSYGRLSGGYKLPFRTMANGSALSPHQYMFNSSLQAEMRLSLTYHVGEDFMDILDGLRAIDEALRFLHMERGDRIGHALALGVAPEVHYRNKQMRSIIKKQDCLDNFVWLIYAVDELDVEIEVSYLSKLRRVAEEYLCEIYGQYGNYTILDYYHSWKLRGDPPEWYMNALLPDEQRNTRRVDLPLFHESEDVCPRNDHCAVERENTQATQLYCLYHYSSSVRVKGDEMIEWEVNDQYIALVRAIQDGMQGKIAKMGISIECNPTSNFLIGTFRDYTKHPVYRFFPISHPSSADRSLRATINTDDLGVFDTSLENEYMLVAAGLACQHDSKGNRLYSDEAIEQYIGQLQHNGIKLSFGSPFLHAQTPTLATEEATGLNLRNIWPI